MHYHRMTTYTTVAIPKEIANRFRELIEARQIPYRSVSEVALDLLRRRLEEIEEHQRLEKATPIVAKH